MTEGTSRVQLDEGDAVVNTGRFMRELRGCAQWLVQISKHLKYSEERLMKANMMGHETVRHFGSVLDDAVPPPKGDWGWPMRHCHDLAVTTLRMLVQLYMGGRGGCGGVCETRHEPREVIHGGGGAPHAHVDG